MFDSVQSSDVFPLLVVLTGMLVGLIIVVFAIISGILKARAREETKREIAAYVAEGSISAETAIALLRSDNEADVCIGAIKAVVGKPNVAPA